jgi:hypothetical protein
MTLHPVANCSRPERRGHGGRDGIRDRDAFAKPCSFALADALRSRAHSRRHARFAAQSTGQTAEALPAGFARLYRPMIHLYRLQPDGLNGCPRWHRRDLSTVGQRTLSTAFLAIKLHLYRSSTSGGQ